MIFSTDHWPVVRQFDLWRQRWDPIIEMQAEGDTAGGFRATNTIWDVGDFAFSRVVAPSLRTSRRAAQVRRDQIDTWFLACARRGRMSHVARGSSADLVPGVPMLFSMGDPYESRRTDIHWVTVMFSRDFARELNPLLDAARNRPLHGPLGQLLGDFLVSITDRIDRLTPEEARRLALPLRQMLGACLAPSADRIAEAAPALDATRRERVRLAIRDAIASPTLSPAKLCRMVGMSRSSLYRLFEPQGGVARAIQEARLRAAHSALADVGNRQSIRAIAESVGFVDAAGFSRSFRRRFGCSPRDVRHNPQQAGAETGVAAVSAASMCDVQALLRRL